MTMIEKNTTPVSEEVKKNVKKYLKQHNLGELVDVIRASEWPEDYYLYHVIARNPNERKLFHNGEYTYSCWTSWNETSQSLNFGHYQLESEERAREICSEFFNKVPDTMSID